MIYILHATNGGPIKIGCSVTPAQRRSQVSSLFPYGVELLASFEGGLATEKFLHRCFAPIAVSTEWFRSGPVIWRFVVDVIDGGRPAFIPSDNEYGNDDLRAIAAETFGGPKEVMRGLGYADATTYRDTLSLTGRATHSARARVLFANALKARALPQYILDLHDAVDAATLEAAE
jgi:hypothetical protein